MWQGKIRNGQAKRTYKVYLLETCRLILHNSKSDICLNGMNWSRLLYPKTTHEELLRVLHLCSSRVGINKRSELKLHRITDQQDAQQLLKSKKMTISIEIYIEIRDALGRIRIVMKESALSGATINPAIIYIHMTTSVHVCILPVVAQLLRINNICKLLFRARDITLTG